MADVLLSFGGLIIVVLMLRRLSNVVGFLGSVVVENAIGRCGGLDSVCVGDGARPPTCGAVALGGRDGARRA